MVTKLDATDRSSTPTLRLLSLIEAIAAKNQFFSLQSLTDELGWAKPTMHRMLQQLEHAGIVVRESGGGYFNAGWRLHSIARNALLNNTLNGARRTVLEQLMNAVGEAVYLAACFGSDVVCIDSVDTNQPLQYRLQQGVRLPIHCTASGKLFLAQMSPLQRRRLLEHCELAPLTGRTVLGIEDLRADLRRVADDGYAISDEEYIVGLIGIAVSVPVIKGQSNLAVAIQAPKSRVTREKALTWLPALYEASQALALIDLDTQPDAG